MKVKELIEKLTELRPEYNEAELEFSVKGRYDYHKLSLNFVSHGASYNSKDEEKLIVSFSLSYINKPDEVPRGEELRAASAKLKISFGVPAEFTDDYEDFVGFAKQTGRGYRRLEFVVNLKDHTIVDWEQKHGHTPGNLFYKIRDEGTYTLLDENDKEIKQLEGYVPNALIPEPNGYGDYIELKVNADGVITNWSKDDSFHEFLF